MNIFKNSLVSTNLINNTLESLDKKDILNVAERNFLNPTAKILNENLSLTDSQDINHQLRYFESHRGLRLINSITFKLSQQLIIEGIKDIEFSFNPSQISKLELFFLDRLNHFSEKNLFIRLKISDDHTLADMEKYDFKTMLSYLSIGDLWTASFIGEKILPDNSDEVDFLHKLAIVQNNIGNTFAGETLLKRIVSKEYDTSKENQLKISALYILAMLYIRHHDKSFHNIELADKYLNIAFDLLNDQHFVHDDKDFMRIFNRNGHALILFKQNKIQEAINLLNDKIKELDVLIMSGKDYGLLHKTVLLYNISQCYKVLGNYRESISILEEVINFDSNDPDYHYEIVKILFENDEPEEALEWLNLVEKKNIADLSIQWTLKGYYYLLNEDYVKAASCYKKAYFLEYNEEYLNEILYSYLYSLYQIGDYTEILKINIKEFVIADSYKKDIDNIFEKSRVELSLENSKV